MGLGEGLLLLQAGGSGGFGFGSVVLLQLLTYVLDLLTTDLLVPLGLFLDQSEFLLQHDDLVFLPSARPGQFLVTPESRVLLTPEQRESLLRPLPVLPVLV